MINIISCDVCIHYEICGKKDIYAKFSKEIDKVSIPMEDNGIRHAKDYEDIILDLKCKHLRKERSTNFKPQWKNNDNYAPGNGAKLY